MFNIATFLHYFIFLTAFGGRHAVVLARAMAVCLWSAHGFFVLFGKGVRFRIISGLLLVAG
jgi:hypothetical protein